MSSPERPRVGVFDSGMGGLTVLKALRGRLPQADHIYLGDTARLPYGTKSAATITQYALQSARALVAKNIQLLVIACNTASAVALPVLRDVFAPLSVLGVIEPGAAAGAKATRNGRIAVIATEGTVRDGAYVRAIHKQNSDIIVTQRACPLFVALAEEGWVEGDIAVAIARRYLEPLFARQDAPDTLVLGCTHFPVLKRVIASILPDVQLVDSASTTADTVAALLEPSEAGQGTTQFLVTDSTERFARIGSLFLGERITPGAVELIDLAPN